MHVDYEMQILNTFLFRGSDVDECAHNCTGTCVYAVETFRCVDRESLNCGLGFRYDTENAKVSQQMFFLQWRKVQIAQDTAPVAVCAILLSRGKKEKTKNVNVGTR